MQRTGTDTAARVALLDELVHRHRAHVTSRREAQLTALHDLVTTGESWLQDEGARVRTELAALAEHAEVRGVPPRWLDVIGWGRRELAYNKLLAWLVDRDGSHGAGPRVLQALLDRCGPRELADEVASGAEVAIRDDERWPDPPGGQDRPDLLVIGQRGVLLVESKVDSQETSPDQYERYATKVETLAGDRPHATWLLAPTPRSTPGTDTRGRPWSGVLTHPQLASLLETVVRSGVTRWTRISLLLVAWQLRHAEDPWKALQEARRLVRATTGRAPRVPEVVAMRAATRTLVSALDLEEPT